MDEVYDGGSGQLKATDPIRGVELEYELIDGPIQEEHGPAVRGDRAEPLKPRWCWSGRAEPVALP